jgi:hypothetical protein
MEATTGTPSVEAGTEQAAATPAVEAAPAPAPETAPPAQEAAPAPAQPEVAADLGLDKYSKLMKAFGDIPEEPSAALLDSIDERSIEQLPDSVKGLFKHMVAQQRMAYSKREGVLGKRAEELNRRAGQIEADARKLISNRAQLNQVLMNPRFQEMLKAADKPVEEMPDAFTPEGIQARIEKGIAEGMKKFQAPITEAAYKAQQQARYSDFVAEHPQMKDASFKREVRGLMEQRAKAGSPVTLEDAYEKIDRQRLLRAEADRTEKERQARSQSARKISRATMSSSPDTGDPVPKWVTERGYGGSRGNLARIKYLRDNPKALAKLRTQQKGRRSR